MKNITTLLIMAACTLVGFTANAGDNPTSLKAQKLCGTGFDFFSSKTIEGLLGLEANKKLTTYEVVLYVPEDKEVFKYALDATGRWNFESIMKSVKERAKTGSMLFIDEAVTSDKQAVEQTGFYLR